jgi:hypothetical protein
MPATCDGSCDCRESLSDLLNYLQHWPFGTLIERAPGESLTRDEMHDRMAHRAHIDPAFRRELLTNPRMVYMIALEEAQGIQKLDYICQVKEVRVLEESTETIYLAIPTCHYGCQAEGVAGPPPEAAGTCHVCGMAFPAGGCTTAEESMRLAPGIAASREEIERAILDRTAREPSFREALLFEPNETYRNAALSLCDGELPDYLTAGVEVRVLAETDRSILYRLPAEDPLARPEGPIVRAAIPEAVALSA